MSTQRRKRMSTVAASLAALLLLACNGVMVQESPGAGSSDPPPIDPVVEPPPPLPPAPTEPPDPPADPLASWFEGGFAGKKVVFWGNSTVSNAVYFFDSLRKHALPGGALDGLDPALILNYGSNGASLAAMLDGKGAYPVEAVIAAAPDLLVIRGPLINDVRTGRTPQQAAEQLLGAALERILAGSSRTVILLTTENSLLTTDVNGFGYVQPNEAAQQYSDILRGAVLAMDGRYPNVRVLDVMALLYGTVSSDTSPLMYDQLHPSAAGQRAEANLLVTVIGRS